MWLWLFNIRVSFTFRVSCFVFARNLMNSSWFPIVPLEAPRSGKPAALSASSSVSSSIIMETVKSLILSPPMSFCMRLARVYNLPR